MISLMRVWRLLHLLLLSCLVMKGDTTVSCKLAPKVEGGEILCSIPSWPLRQEGEGERVREKVKVNVLLPDQFYSSVKKKFISEDEIKLLPSYRRAGPAILAGLEEADRRGWVNQFYFSFTFRDSHCDNTATIKALIIEGMDFDVVFGPSCEYALAPVGRVVKLFNKPLLTAGGLTFNYAEPKTKPNQEFYMMTRTGYDFLDVSRVLTTFMQENNWNQIILIYSKNDRKAWSGDHSCHQMMSTIVKQTKAVGFLPKPLDLEVFEMKNKTSDVYLHMFTEQVPRMNMSLSVMCADPSRIRRLMIAAGRAGMVDTGQFVFFNIDLFSTEPPARYRPWHSYQASPGENREARSAFSSVLTIRGGANTDSKEFERVSGRVKQIAWDQFAYNHTEDVSAFSANFYDAALLYAKALNETMEKVGTLNNSENLLLKMMNRTDRTLKGAAGPIVMDSNRDRRVTYHILAMDPFTHQYRLARAYAYSQDTRSYNLSYSDIITWPGSCSNDTYRAAKAKQGSDPCSASTLLTAPLDYPPCGFTGDICRVEKADNIPLILSIVFSCFSLVILVVACFVYRHFKEEAEIARMIWKIEPDEVMPTKMERGRFGSKVSIPASQVSIDSMGCEDSKKKVFVNTVYFRGNIVAKKDIITDNITLNRALMLDLKTMKELEHNHLTRFVGACLEPGNSFLITEYCSRGSLQDILEDGDLELDNEFRLSLINDIIRGMAFLHSSEVKFHGNLKSSNCVVDGRFVVKLTDFGLHNLRSHSYSVERYSHQYFRDKLWTAPELLQTDPDLLNCNRPEFKRSSSQARILSQNLFPLCANESGNPKSDVYSFSIILHEILVRTGTWGTDIDFKDPEVIIGDILWYNSRPPIDETVTETGLLSLITRCWAESPTSRPDFPTIKTEMKRMNKDKASGNILDNLLSRMERYANNLESLVDERTQDYLEEKRKCEDLLYELLPKSVAGKLIQGQHVIAETFQAVTIYFSDIVGFTALSSISSPLQVVDMLNDLYTLFDNIIPKFDVYKVETIGDSYMVVSGLPVRNGNNHAREISRMSLGILEAVKTFKIRHKPDQQLQIRIGIHTGPCCAGVVGIKMPRYCLFGDTVNTSSRMESTGQSLKIHVSEDTYQALLPWGTFVLESRGVMEVKGKGKMRTFWLQKENPIESTMIPDIPHQYSNIPHQYSDIPHQYSDMSHQLSDMSHQLSDMSHQDSDYMLCASPSENGALGAVQNSSEDTEVKVNSVDTKGKGITEPDNSVNPAGKDRQKLDNSVDPEVKDRRKPDNSVDPAVKDKRKPDNSVDTAVRVRTDKVNCGDIAVGNTAGHCNSSNSAKESNSLQSNSFQSNSFQSNSFQSNSLLSTGESHNIMDTGVSETNRVTFTMGGSSGELTGAGQTNSSGPEENCSVDLNLNT